MTNETPVAPQAPVQFGDRKRFPHKMTLSRKGKGSRKDLIPLDLVAHITDQMDILLGMREGQSESR